MTEQKSLKEKIIDDILKTGFPTELSVGRKLQAQDWQIEESKYYVDQDEGKGREIDLTASRVKGRKGMSIYFGLHLFIEVKMSNQKSWVIFTSERRPKELLSQVPQATTNLRQQYLKPFESGHPLASATRIGRSSYVPFSNEENAQIYKAITSATKAALEGRRNQNDYNGFLQANPGISIFVPVVIFNGRLFEAWLHDDSTVKIEETNILPYNFHYLSPAYKSGNNMVTVMTLDYLEKYSEDIKQWAETSLTAIASNNRL